MFCDRGSYDSAISGKIVVRDCIKDGSIVRCLHFGQNASLIQSEMPLQLKTSDNTPDLSETPRCTLQCAYRQAPCVLSDSARHRSPSNRYWISLGQIPPSDGIWTVCFAPCNARREAVDSDLSRTGRWPITDVSDVTLSSDAPDHRTGSHRRRDCSRVVWHDKICGGAHRRWN